MPAQTIDLTKLYIIKEIQQILLKSEEYKGNIILKKIYYKNQIVEHVLSSLERKYITVNLLEIPKESSDILPLCSIEEQTTIRQLIELKIHEIVRQILERKEPQTVDNKVDKLK